MTLTDFIKAPKSLMIAAAGHGKTHTIAECVQLCPVGQCQLILTHTHAGIASIKAKMVELKVEPQKYHIETITSFAQHYVLAYYRKDDLPDQSKSTEYFDAVQARALRLFSNKHILDVLRLTYVRLFVDEYQDCTIEQHQMIMLLGQVLPVHLFGDELQGIFGFAGRLVDFEQDLTGFVTFDLLKKPWRWHKEGNCKELGNRILEWRNALVSDDKCIRLESDKAAHLIVIPTYYEALGFERGSDYYRILRKVINDYDSESMLILFPSYKEYRRTAKGEIELLRGRIPDRIKIKDGFDFGNRFLLAEAIDDMAFYANARNIDDLIMGIGRARKKEKNVFDVVNALSFNKTDLGLWFNRDNDFRLKNKQGENKVKGEKLMSLYTSFIKCPCKKGFLEIIDFCINDAGMKPKRSEVVYSILYCLKNYPEEEMTVYESMKEMRNTIRRGGRKIQGRCIGTTLLTKGLEFDTVIVLDAHRFEDSKNFYVAISRACKNLVIITKKSTLHFDR